MSKAKSSAAGPKGLSRYIERAVSWLVLGVILVHATQLTVPQLAWLAKGSPGEGPAALGKISKVNVTVADLLIFLAFGLWAFDQVFLKRRWRRVFSVPCAVFVLLCLAVLSAVPFLKPRMVFTLGQSFDRGDALKELIQFAEFFFAAFVLFRFALRDRKLLRRAVIVLLAIWTVVILVGWVQYARVHSGAAGEANVTGVVGTFGVPAAETQRHEVAGTASNRNVLAAYLALALPLLWGLALCGEGLLRPWAGVLVLVGLALVPAGGPLLGVLAGVCVVSFMKSEKWLAATILALLVYFAATFAVLSQSAGILCDSVLIYKQKDMYRVMGGDVAGADLLGELADGEAAGTRLWPWQQRYLEWQAALNGMRWNPWFGVGIGNFRRNVNFYYTNPQGAYYTFVGKPRGVNLMEEGANNYWAVLGLELGVPALFVMGWLILHLGRSCAGAAKKLATGMEHGLVCGALGALCSIVVTNFFASTFVRGVGVLAILLFALCRALPEVGGDK